MRESCTISVPTFGPREYAERIFHEFEAIARKYEGRPHWGKIHYLSANELSKLYPRWNEFMRARLQLDPHEIFLSDYLKQLFVKPLNNQSK